MENNGNLENDGKIKFNLIGNLINNNKISSSSNLNIIVNEILNNGVNSIIGLEVNLIIIVNFLKNEGNFLFGEGIENKLKIIGNIINIGVISLLGKFKIEVKDVVNDKYIILDNDLIIDVNFIINKGFFYLINNMKVDFKENFLNDKVEIYLSGDIIINFENGIFINRVGDIESERNIRIVVKDIKNFVEVIGNYKVVGIVFGN